ncbi:MAG: PEGA domain-containing protein [Proteobacteria bacterium]|nr:PEGA domain-containing protein [Pseudomonadota bacterium]
MRIGKINLTLITLNMTVWSFAFLMGTGRVKLSAVKLQEIELIATPERVRILINGTPYDSGNYITTPTTIRLLPGRHRLTLQRAGYHSNTSTIVSTAGQQTPAIHSVLESTTANLQEVTFSSIEGDGLGNIDLILDGGLEVGSLPMTVSDVLPGGHILELKIGLLYKSSVRCQFEVPTIPPPEPLKITLEKQGKKLKVNGCKRIK